jgi:putative phosphoribosyl transferase
MSEVVISAAGADLQGLLELPTAPLGVVAFSHGSGSGRHSPRNQFVAAELRRVRLGTLLLDLLTVEEDRDHEARFDIELLSERLGHTVRFLAHERATRRLPIGLFGASTGAASALRVAAAMPHQVKAVVSRGGRPDLAGRLTLMNVRAPTLLIVGGEDRDVIELNQAALATLTHCTRDLVLVPGATHLFEGPGTLEAVARRASEWFTRHLTIPAHAER